MSVKSNGKNGIINIDGKEIIPTIYTDIVFMGKEFIKVKREEGWSLGRAYKLTYYYESSEPVYEPVYEVHGLIFDDISLCSENEQWVDVDVFIVRSGNKYGCVNSYGTLLLPVEYETIELKASFCNQRPWAYVYHFIIKQNGKVGFCCVSYYNRNDYCSYHSEFVYLVKPQFDECVLLHNLNSVLEDFHMGYAAVRKDNKWGILDQKPRQITYKAINLNLADESVANYDDLIFKYDSLDELAKDADYEFKRRYDKYFHPWSIRRDPYGQDDRIVEEGK